MWQKTLVLGFSIYVVGALVGYLVGYQLGQRARRKERVDIELILPYMDALDSVASLVGMTGNYRNMVLYDGSGKAPWPAYRGSVLDRIRARVFALQRVAEIVGVEMDDEDAGVMWSTKVVRAVAVMKSREDKISPVQVDMNITGVDATLATLAELHKDVTALCAQYPEPPADMVEQVRRHYRNSPVAEQTVLEQAAQADIAQANQGPTQEEVDRALTERLRYKTVSRSRTLLDGVGEDRHDHGMYGVGSLYVTETLLPDFTIVREYRFEGAMWALLDVDELRRKEPTFPVTVMPKHESLRRVCIGDFILREASSKHTKFVVEWGPPPVSGVPYHEVFATSHKDYTTRAENAWWIWGKA
jgi:hypothetical protein